MLTPSPYTSGLDQNGANHVPLTPTTFLDRAAAIWPERTAVVHGAVRRNWVETAVRCRRLASALARRGIGRGQTVAFLAANTPELFEAHFGVPMMGGVLNAINTRLDPEAIAFILAHGEARILFVDREFSAAAKRAVTLLARRIPVIDIDDPSYEGGKLIGEKDFSPRGMRARRSRDRPTSGTRSRSTTPRARPVARRASSTTTAAPT